MRIRIPFAVVFGLLCLLSAYLGLSNVQLPFNDKLGHLVAFFFMTLSFYWILEASRRRVVNLTLVVFAVADIGSEFVQAAVNPNRKFDPLDILANLLGSGSALLLCMWYHRRMLERKRLAKSYQPVATEDGAAGEEDVGGGEELADLETGQTHEEEAAAKP